MTLFDEKKTYSVKDWLIFFLMFCSVMVVIYAQSKLRNYIMKLYKKSSEPPTQKEVSVESIETKGILSSADEAKEELKKELKEEIKSGIKEINEKGIIERKKKKQQNEDF
ncbi:hypothetical protein CDIK_0026 [Cucumispora dikerogammari]|nr:hypothetical protein CDIK_0026 [Cucumispora dikerogammari]